MRARDRAALIVVGAGALALSAAMTLLRDSAVEEHLERLLPRLLSAPCSFSGASFSVLDGLLVRDLTVLDPNDPLAAPLLSVGETRIEYTLDVFGEGPRLTDVVLVAPRLRVVRDQDGTVSLLSVVRGRDDGTDSDDTDASRGLPRVRIIGGDVELSDPALLADGASLSLHGIRAGLAEEDGVLTLTTTATADLIGDFDARATLDRDGQSGQIDITLKGAELSSSLAGRLESRAATFLRDLDAAGTLSGRVTLTLVDGAVADADGELVLDDVAVSVRIPDDTGRAEPRPLRLTSLNGKLIAREGRVSIESLTGRLLDADLSVDGGVDLRPPSGMTDDDRRVDLRVGIDGLGVGPELVAHLPSHLGEIQRRFAIHARVGATVHVRGRTERPTVDARLVLTEGRASYEGGIHPDTGARFGFPWQVTDLEGTVEVTGTRVDIDATGRHGPARVTVQGMTDLTADRRVITDIRIGATDVPLDDDLKSAFLENGEALFARWRPDGVAERIDVRVVQDPDVDALGEAATDVDLEFDGRATFHPSLLPADLAVSSGTVRVHQPVVDGQRIDTVTLQGVEAAGDGFTITANGAVTTDAAGTRDDLHLGLSGSANETLMTALQASPDVPKGTKRALRLLQPRGPLRAEVLLRGDATVREDSVTVTLDGVSVAGWDGIPLALSDARGTVGLDGETLTVTGLTARALGDARIRIDGTLDGLASESIVPRLVIAATDAPLGARLRTALGTLGDPLAPFWDEVRPGDDAFADIDLIVGPDDQAAGPIDARLRRIRGGLNLQGFALVAEDGTARFADGLVETDLVGRIGDAAVTIAGGRLDTRSGDATAVLTARGLPFPRGLAPVLPPETVDSLADAVPGRALHLNAMALTWESASRRLTLEGRATLRPRERATASGETILHDADVVLRPAVLTLPESGPVEVAAAVEIVRAHIEPGIEIEELIGHASVTGTLGGDDATLQVALTDAAFRTLGRPFRDVSLHLDVEGAKIRVEDLSARLHGGLLTGQIGAGGAKVAYRGDLSLTGARLSRVLSERPGQTSEGLLDVRVRFRNPTGKARDLQGAGRAEMRDARLVAPVATAVTNAVNGALLGLGNMQGEFSEGFVEFDLRGDRALVRDLYIGGAALPPLGTLELRDGRGAVGLDGERIDLIVYPRIKFDPFGLDPTGLFDSLLSVAQVLLRRVRIEGTMRNPTTSWEVVGEDGDAEFAPRPQPAGELLPYGPEPW